MLRNLSAGLAAAGLLLALSGEAWGAVARDDRVRAELIEGEGGGYRVVLRLGELLDNDRIVPPLRQLRLRATRQSLGIKKVQLRGGGRKGPLRVVVRLTDRFARSVLASGREDTGFEYLLRDSCRRASRCGPRLSRASVDLRVVSPS